MSQRKVAVVLTDRSNYGRLKPVMQAIKDHPKLELQVIATGSMVLDRFGRAVDICTHDGFQIDSEIYVEIEGSLPITMGKSIGLTIIEMSNSLNTQKPDVLLIIGDRYETLGATVAAAYMNICIAHIQGGEVSGSLDENARHAITKLAHYHFPSTKRAYENLIKIGEAPETVFLSGCPIIDLASSLDRRFGCNPFANRGLGSEINCDNPYVLAIFHPDTGNLSASLNDTHQLVSALMEIDLPVCWLWSNIDAGADNINRFIRRKHEYGELKNFQLIKNFPPDIYQQILANAACAVGNSSSFVRDSTFYGTPVVLVGERQTGRETGKNAITVSAGKPEIVNAVKRQLINVRFDQDTLYGDGNASRIISDTIAAIPLYTQKKISYSDQ